MELKDILILKVMVRDAEMSGYVELLDEGYIDKSWKYRTK